jgi:hypothetical protein
MILAYFDIRPLMGIYHLVRTAVNIHCISQVLDDKVAVETILVVLTEYQFDCFSLSGTISVSIDVETDVVPHTQCLV